MSCPVCRTALEHGERLYCRECDIHYPPPANVKGKPIDEVGCLDDVLNIFYAKIGDSTLIVKQPRAEDLPQIKEALKLASEYTYLRFPSWLWKHSEGVCFMPIHMRNSAGRFFLIMVLDGEMVGFSHHKYWTRAEDDKEMDVFPTPVGSLCGNVELCVLDTYQRQGIGSIYAVLSEYIAKHNGVHFILGETFKEGGMLNIRMRDGWTNFGERKAEDGSMRVLIGKAL